MHTAVHERGKLGCLFSAGEVLDIIIVDALGLGKEEGKGEGGEGLGLVAQVGVALKGLNRFMRQLSQ